MAQLSTLVVIANECMHAVVTCSCSATYIAVKFHYTNDRSRCTVCGCFVNELQTKRQSTTINALLHQTNFTFATINCAHVLTPWPPAKPCSGENIGICCLVNQAIHLLLDRITTLLADSCTHISIGVSQDLLLKRLIIRCFCMYTLLDFLQSYICRIVTVKLSLCNSYFRFREPRLCFVV